MGWHLAREQLIQDAAHRPHIVLLVVVGARHLREGKGGRGGEGKGGERKEGKEGE